VTVNVLNTDDVNDKTGVSDIADEYDITGVSENIGVILNDIAVELVIEIIELTDCDDDADW
jgi:hypothetical protein